MSDIPQRECSACLAFASLSELLNRLPGSADGLEGVLRCLRTGIISQPGYIQPAEVLHVIAWLLEDAAERLADHRHDDTDGEHRR